jgi:hypothetical protein
LLKTYAPNVRMLLPGKFGMIQGGLISSFPTKKIPYYAFIDSRGFFLTNLKRRVLKMNTEKLQKRGAVAKKVTKQEFFGKMVKFCPVCKGEQFLRIYREDGSPMDRFCENCFGSGISPKEPAFKRAFVFGK